MLFFRAHLQRLAPGQLASRGAFWNFPGSGREHWHRDGLMPLFLGFSRLFLAGLTILRFLQPALKVDRRHNGSAIPRRRRQLSRVLLGQRMRQETQG